MSSYRLKKNYRLVIPTILFLFIMNSMYAQTKIEGIHYLDKTPVSIEIKDGIIVKVQQLEKLSDTSQELYISPGLFDNQVNGYAGISFAFGGSELTADGIKTATEGLWKKGITTYLPTLTSNSQETLMKNFAVLAKTEDDPSLYGSLPGFHLEGPYISPVDGFRGAHPKQHVRKPDWQEFMDLYEASGQHIMTVTGCTLGEAIRMGSTNPAKLYHLTDRGELAPGMRADLILFSIGERELNIEKTYVKGQLVYEAGN